MSQPSTLPGFANPVDDAQTVFRAVLESLSRPGVPTVLPVSPPAPPGGLSAGMLAIALALCDRDTPLWLDAAADTPEARHHLRFHCGSAIAAQPTEAAFAFIAKPLAMPHLLVFNQGRADFPDRSATLVIKADLSGQGAPALEMTGPGVKGNDLGLWQALSISGLPAWFWEDWEANHAAYPLGVDVIFVDNNAGAARILGLPRTARVRPTVNASTPRASKEQSACM